MKYIPVVLVIILGVALLLPIGMMFLGSLKGYEEAVFAPNRVVPRRPTFENYNEILKYPVVRWLFNSTVIAVARVGGAILLSIATAFGLSKYEFRGKGLVLGVVMASILIPVLITTIPRYVLTRGLGLYNSMWGVILPGVVVGANVWFLYKYMGAIPDDLINMGRLDGLGPWGLLRHVVVPMCTPAIAALVALGAVGAWNDYLWPMLILRKPELMVLPVGVREVIWFEAVTRRVWTGFHKENGALGLAGAVIATIPGLAIFLFAQKYFIGGLFHKSTGGE